MRFKTNTQTEESHVKYNQTCSGRIPEKTSSQKAADIGGYKSKTGARKLLDKMIEKGLITKIGNGPATKYVI